MFYEVQQLQLTEVKSSPTAAHKTRKGLAWIELGALATVVITVHSVL